VESQPPDAIGNIRGVLFDLDNTLYNRDLAFEQWIRAFVAKQFPDESEDGQDAIVQQVLAIDDHGYVNKRVLFTQARALYPTIAEEVDALCERFYQEWLVYVMLDAGTQSVLNALDQKAIPFGIVTNGPVQQNLKIDQLGLRSRIQCLFISEEFGCNKPDPAIFLAAASCLGLPCEQILFVGDNPRADICGAQAVGMTTAWLPYGTTWPATITEVQPDYVIGSIADLAAILALPT
jgi:putative hydrolase of the HAD superfamily